MAFRLPVLCITLHYRQPGTVRPSQTMILLLRGELALHVEALALTVRVGLADDLQSCAILLDDNTSPTLADRPRRQRNGSIQARKVLLAVALGYCGVVYYMQMTRAMKGTSRIGGPDSEPGTVQAR